MKIGVSQGESKTHDPCMTSVHIRHSAHSFTSFGWLSIFNLERAAECTVGNVLLGNPGFQADIVYHVDSLAWVFNRLADQCNRTET